MDKAIEIADDVDEKFGTVFETPYMFAYAKESSISSSLDASPKMQISVEE